MTRLVGRPSYLGNIYIGHAITTHGACDALRRYLGIDAPDERLTPHLTTDDSGFHFAVAVMRLASERASA